MRKDNHIQNISWKEIQPIEQDGEWWVLAEDLIWYLNVNPNRIAPQFKTQHRETGETLVSEEGFYQAVLVSDEAEAFQEWFLYFFRDKMVATSWIKDARTAMGFKPLEVLEFAKGVIKELYE
ncbi:MAG: hypothetical protein K2H85_03185 [Allobaculum sp.]|nr:hypothetical protein [Allobaculum sp.]